MPNTKTSSENTATSKTMESNAEVVWKIYDAFRRADLKAARALLTDDVVWELKGKSPLAGAYRGPDNVLGYFGQLMERSSGSFRIEMIDVAGGKEHGVSYNKASANRPGKHLDLTENLIFQVHDGKIASVVQVAHDQYAWDTFWS